jgi:hypothetical protein
MNGDPSSACMRSLSRCMTSLRGSGYRSRCVVAEACSRTVEGVADAGTPGPAQLSQYMQETPSSIAGGVLDAIQTPELLPHAINDNVCAARGALVALVSGPGAERALQWLGATLSHAAPRRSGRTLPTRKWTRSRC